MTEYSRMVKGSFTATGTSQMINLPFQPDYVEFWNYTNLIAVPTQDKCVKGYWDANLIVGTANPTFIELYNNANTVWAGDSIVANGISSFNAGLSLQYGANQAVGDITKASPAVVTASAAHNLKSGDVVVFDNLIQTATTGMQQIAGIPFTVTVTGTTTFTIPWNTNQSNYTVYNSGTATTAASFKKVLYPYLYAPGVNIITGIDTGATTTVHTTHAHNFVVGQEVAFRIPTVSTSSASWGTTQLNSLPNTTIPGSPSYGYVVSVTDYNTVEVNINSSSYTAYNSNVPFAAVSGLQYPQIVAVGDVNTGGVPVSAGSALYPPPFTRPIGSTTVNTINGPAIQGAFFNNTGQGFAMGPGVAVINSNVTMMETNGVILWRAYLHDGNFS